MEKTYDCGCFVSGALQMCKTHAAAPELLTALEKIRNLERRNFREAWDLLREVDRLAEAAIRKAKGE